MGDHCTQLLSSVGQARANGRWAAEQAQSAKCHCKGRTLRVAQASVQSKCARGAPVAESGAREGEQMAPLKVTEHAPAPPERVESRSIE